ncbi:restriction endonuclease subunit S [Fibrobacter sp. UWB5]|uniref:restriction endonuclease subunit S n=1 Tax=Fibrobacter sp. UWB5 TaxID=1964360 RepID=UPI000B523A88|nr:restriction endonuclease subunit S [Fibrobacter sp. UWB5]OWV11294.1 hypothetical protein B7989_09605 [Fibrobacter sp. UWB5]
MKRNWEYKNIEECLEKVTVVSKLQTKDFLPKGKFPIVSQEVDYISGYWNNDSDVVRLLHPVVVFGDHSRVVKYIDFDFVVGADGVKILSPKDFLNPKFLYYFVKSADIPSLGYSRHYKLLREKDVPVPPLEEQSRIVAELDLLTGIIDKRNAQLKELDNLAQAIFYDMFGDPIENPKRWDVKNLGDLCVKLTDGTHNSPINTLSGDYPYITAKNIRKNGIDLSDLTYVTKEIHQEIYSRCNPEYGDVLYIKDGITTGIAQVNVLDFEFSLLSSVALLKLDKAVANPYFITGFLNSDSVYKAARSNMGGAAITRLTLTKLKSFRVAVPPLALQQSFAEKIQSIEKQKETIRASIADTQKLLDYTMDKYFG